MKLKICLQCGGRYCHRYSKQWRCPQCTAKWRDQKIQEREQLALAEQYSQIHAPGTPAPLAAAPADVYAATLNKVPDGVLL